jgi:hypothetical protein
MIGKKILATTIAVALVAAIFVISPNIEYTTVSAFPPTTTPGVDDWGNATTDLVYNPDTTVRPRINTTGMTAGTYFLYKPAYNCSATGYRYATQLEWFEQVLRTDTSTPVTLTVTTPGNLYQISGPIILDRAGMWVFGDDPHTIDGTDETSFESFFWVNTSQELAISDIGEFNYGSNTSKTITVKQDGATPEEPVFIDLIAPDGSTVFHQYEADGIYSFGTYLNITMAGNYTVRSYADLDKYSSAAYLYNDEGITEGYDETYGIMFSGAKNTTLATNGDGWQYNISGPWDPPEINASELVFRVKPGEPLATVKEGNRTMYWNFSGEVNISIKDTSDDPIPAADYTVTIYNSNDDEVTNYYTYTAGDQTETADVNKYDGYCLINSTGWGVNQSDWTIYGSNGTWYAYIYVDSNSDRTEGNKQWTEEWNATVEWAVRSAPGAQFKWINDGGGDLNDGELPSIPSSASAPINIQFQIIGRDHTYYGAGGATAVEEAKENITIAGNALFTGRLDKIPGVSYSGGTWTVPIIPTMNAGGGSLEITATWEDYGSISEILAIGGTNYIRNGTIVSVTPKEFEIGTDQTFTVQVQYSDGSTINSASVYLYYLDDGEVASAGDPLQGHIVSEDTYGFDGYSLGFNETQQRDNQTEAGFGTIKAPRNLTVYAVAYVGGTAVYGWALIRMKPNMDLKVTFEAIDSPATSTLLAGYKYSYFYINITKIDDAGNASETPNKDDYTDITVKIYDEEGDDVTTSIGSITASDIAATNMGNDYIYALKNEYITKAGVFTVYAKNYTSDSTGNNGTIDVKQAHVECDKSPFIWAYDENISATFTVTSEIDGERLNGTLRIENISWTDGTYNMTWTNTSAVGNDTLDLDEGEGFLNGQITVNDITASYLPPGEAVANITFWFKPELSDGGSGEWARATGLVPVSVPTITPDPMYVAVGQRTLVNILVTGRGDPLDGIFIGLDGRGVLDNGTSGSDGIATFSVMPTSAGNISIDVGEEGRTVDTVLIATNWMIDLSVPAQAYEREDFTVTVTEQTSGDPVEGATVEVQSIGTAETDANGEVTFTAPEVTSDRTLEVSATAPGYAPDKDKNIVIINIPKIYISAPKEAAAGQAFKVKAGGDDGNNNGIAVTLTGAGKTYTETTVNGEATFTVEKDGKYTITAQKSDYADADPVTITIKPGSPGFELLTLIVAIGIAFILLRRRRN